MREHDDEATDWSQWLKAVLDNVTDDRLRSEMAACHHRVKSKMGEPATIDDWLSAARASLHLPYLHAEQSRLKTVLDLVEFEIANERSSVDLLRYAHTQFGPHVLVFDPRLMENFPLATEIQRLNEADGKVSKIRGTQYQKKVVAFIDLLGFSESVVASERDAKARDRVFQLIDNLRGAGPTEQTSVDLQFQAMRNMPLAYVSAITNEEFVAQREGGKPAVRKAVFSDSIVLSADAEHIDSLLYEVLQIERMTFRHGVFIRGGIAHGAFSHEGQTAVGPALIDAYIMESREARVPRVLVSEDVQRLASKDSRSKFHIDEDGLTYISDWRACLLPQNPVVPPDAITSSMDIFLRSVALSMNSLKTAIQTETSKSKKESLAEKYAWLSQRMSRLVEWRNQRGRQEGLENFVVEDNVS